MNVNTGELILMKGKLPPEEAMGFTPVPKEHEAEAIRIIDEAEAKNQRAVADMSANTPLVNGAKEQQLLKRKAPSKNKSRMAKASRRRNRK